MTLIFTKDERVRHSCGHIATHKISYSTNSYEKIIAEYESKPCLACAREAVKEQARQVEADREAKKEAAREKARQETADLPALRGSEKQITWATTLRHERRVKWNERLASAKFVIEKPEEVQIKFRQAFEAFVRKPSASWWINNRDMLDKLVLLAFEDVLMGKKS